MLINKLAYMIMLFLLWLVMRMYLFRFTAVVFYTLLLFPVLLWLLLQVQARRIRVGLELSDRITEKNRPFKMWICVNNANRLPVGRLKVVFLYRSVQSEKWQKKKLTFAPERGEHRYSFELSSGHSACLEFIVRSARVFDLLGLFSVQRPGRRERKGAEAAEVVVMPRLYELDASPVRANPYVLVESEVYSGTKSGDDPSEIFDIREYREGDRLNRIHWKTSARTDQLMVKEFGLPVDRSVLLLADFGSGEQREDELGRRDAVREAVLSLSMRLTEDGQAHLLAWFDHISGKTERFEVSGIEEFYEAAGRMLRCGRRLSAGEKRRKRAEEKGRIGTAEKKRGTAGNRSGENTAAQYFSEYGREQYTNIFYVTAEGTPLASMQQLLECRKSAWLSLLCFGGHLREEEAGLPPAGVRFYNLSPDTLPQGLAQVVFQDGE
ncbi:MAG: DUF58 domain-containing protein [Lachnospiraceae bacterium]|nr:DUF58 domain-containing protein [Lachnospiraceae bacterium]